jgi:surface polysaccharide O-acyltransferase-like enzyme
MKRNQSIELLKLFAVFFVVIIHNPFASDFGSAVSAIARFSVPIFFMITGYFVIQPGNTSLKLKKQILKLTKFYIFYEFIYILYAYVIALSTNRSANFPNLLKENFQHILISPIMGYHLWYLINIIWVLIIIYVFNYFNKLKMLFICSIILHLIGIIISNLSMQIFHRYLPLDNTRNFLFFGLFYVILGIYIKKIDIDKIKINKYFILIIAILFCLLQITEKYLWHQFFNSKFGDYYFSSIFASIAIFLFVRKCNVKKEFIQRFVKYSMPIYFLHVLIMSLLGLFSLQIMHIDLKVIKGSIIGNLIYIVLVCIFSCFLYAISKKLFDFFVQFTTKLFRIHFLRFLHHDFKKLLKFFYN